MTDYISPDYPNFNGSYVNFGGNERPVMNQEFYYPGYGSAPYPPDSRRNVTSWNPQVDQNPTYRQGPQYGYQQPEAFRQPQTQVQPFSTYGPGGTQQKGLNSLMEERRYAPPTDQQWVPPTQPAPPTYRPYQYYGDPNQQWNVVPSFERNTAECWSNQYVMPRQVQAPNIDWNTRYTNGQPVQGYPYPQTQQPIFSNQPFEQSWTDLWNQNKNMR